MPFARLKLLLACSLLASTALFTVGVALERAQGENTTIETPSGGVSHTGESGSGGETGGSAEGGSGEASSTPAEIATTAEPTGHDAVFLGVNLESWRLVGVVVVLSLGLATAVWMRPVKPVLALTGVFALAFAAFDLAEVSHQVRASHAGLVAIAAIVALLHLATGGLAVAGVQVA
ncbi:MAG: hypothetical protein HY240_02420 [Actinobacteria bacterium]|nr:hypothetical protein [Actinomycetota bacterium]